MKFIAAEALLFMCSALTVALIVEDLGTVIALAGATCSPVAIFFFPGLFWLKWGPRSTGSRPGARFAGVICLWGCGAVVVAAGLAAVAQGTGAGGR